MNARERNRQSMPTVAAVVDEIRKHFGDCKVIHAKEGNTEVGQPLPDTGIPWVPLADPNPKRRR